jgi:hypothetical protein
LNNTLPVFPYGGSTLHDPRADELDLIADGYAQLAWAVRPLSNRAANFCAERSADFAHRAAFLRSPWATAVMGAMAMVVSWNFLKHV